ncbi:MAG: 6-phosphogluconolactonase [Phycisphaerae bacterium]
MVDRPNVIVKRTPSQASTEAFQRIAKFASDAVEQRGKFSIALAGGTTPRMLYQTMAQGGNAEQIPWDRTDVFFGDERDVPHDDVESNYHMAQRALLDHVPIQPDRVYPMPANAEDLDSAAAEYEQTIRRVVPEGPDGVPQLDVVLLGMGGDGHTASLFPETEVLKEDKKLVASHFVEMLGRNRMTFTYPLINSARHVMVLVTGEDKADTIAKALGPDEPVRPLPIACVHPTGGEITFVLDYGAARNIEDQPQ